MITYEIINDNNKDKYISNITYLMNKCFDEEENVSLIPLINSSQGEVYIFKDNNIIIGFAALIDSNKITHILYFGVDPIYQNRGYGTSILKTIINIKKDNNVIGDLEEYGCDIKENEVVLKRNVFYENVGFKKTNIIYDWHNIKYRVFSTKNIKESEFWKFWQSVGILDDIY